MDTDENKIYDRVSNRKLGSIPGHVIILSLCPLNEICSWCPIMDIIVSIYLILLLLLFITIIWHYQHTFLRSKHNVIKNNVHSFDI